jgi:O-antigen/teichoic acid export membrane protein
MLVFALRFSLPSLVTNFLGWGQSRVGRYVVSFSGAAAGVGLYGIAQSFAQNYGGIVRPAKIVALRILGHALEDDADSPYFLEFFHGFACLALSVAFLVALFLGDVMNLFVAPADRVAKVALPPLIFAAYLLEVYTLYHSLMFRFFKVWFQFWGLLTGFPAVLAATVLLVPRMGFLGAAVAELIGAVAMLAFAHRYASSVSRRPFRFSEKLVFTTAALALAALAEGLALSLISKLVLAVAALTPYLLFHWWRRRELFPVAAGVAGVPVVGPPNPILSRPARG